MRISCDPRTITVSQTNMAKALSLTQGRIAQLVKDGIMVRDGNDRMGGVKLVESIRNYDRMSAPSASSGDDDPDYIAEKAKHEKVKRELAELKLAKAEAEAYDAKTVELVLTEMLSNLRTQLLGLPAKLAPQIEGKTKDEIYTLMTSEIEDKLVELSEYEPEMFTSEVIGDEESD